MSELRYGWEKFADLKDEPNLTDLLRAHWNELGVHKSRMPLDPDFARFQLLEEGGIFKVWAARTAAARTLVGYIGWFIQPHMHYRSTLTAVDDLFLLDPQHRRGLAGYRMFETSLAALRELGVHRALLHEKVHFERPRMEAKVRGRIEALVERAAGGDTVAIDDLVCYFFEGERSGLAALFRRLGAIHTDNIWSLAF